ncbi:hypothetical protein LCGC14_0752810 [marine sediment metagenome]|uniref:Uncharacterized protein n=1 Tax=marine sediment metagenome TaxID=412755 RepID=A0A0F9QN83_9ZZZZ
MFPLKSDMLVEIASLTDTDTNQKVTGATVTMSIFEEKPLKLNTGAAIAAVQKVTPASPVINTIAFTAGGGTPQYEIQVGDKVTGDIGGATAIVKTVTVTSGTWDAGPPGTAAGTLELTNQVGDFQAENLDVGATADVCAVAGNSDQGGSFTFIFDGSTTAAIDGNATLAAIKSALEALGNITTVNVTGGPLDADPIVNGFYVEWASANPYEDGNVPLLIINIASLLGPASVSITVQTRGHSVGEARNAGGGTVGIPIENHERVAGEYIHLIGTANYDGEKVIVSVDRDEVVITEAYAAEVFTGKEEAFVGISGTNLPSIAFSDDGGGDYSATLPDTLEKYSRGKRCIILVSVVKADTNLLLAKTNPTGFYKGT